MPFVLTIIESREICSSFFLREESGAIYQVNEKERSVSLMSKFARTNNFAFINESISYRYCFEEAGMLEAENGVYTRIYRIPSDEAVKGSYPSGMTGRIMENILQKLPEKVTLEYIIRNCHTGKREDFLRGMVREMGREPVCHHLRNLYSRVLQDNSDIGKNKFTRETYLTLAVEAETPGAALEHFREAEQWLRERFYSLYGFYVKPMEMSECLELLYDIYHAGTKAEGFRNRIICTLPSDE